MNDTLQDRVEHLKLVEGVLTRLSGNNSQMKTWSVSLVTAAFVFSGLSNNPHWVIGAGGCVAVVAFWWMDAQYLRLQKCFIRLFRAVADGETVKPFEMDYRPYAASVDSTWKLVWSWSVLGFYGALLIVMLLLVAALLTLGECNEAQSLL